MARVEILGLIATVIILLSFISSDIRKVRCINAVGCILFIIYGAIISAHSVWILNSACLCLQLFKLSKELKLQNTEKSGVSTSENNNL